MFDLRTLLFVCRGDSLFSRVLCFWLFACLRKTCGGFFNWACSCSAKAGICIPVSFRVVYYTFLPLRLNGQGQTFYDGGNCGEIVKTSEPWEKVQLTIHVNTNIGKWVQFVAFSFLESGCCMRTLVMAAVLPNHLSNSVHISCKAITGSLYCVQQ